MSWDLTVYGVNWPQMQANERLIDVSEIFSQIDKYYKRDQKHFTETEAGIFLPEIFTLRSKQICFAIQQLVGLFEEQVAVPLLGRHLSQENYNYILNKEDITELLAFLKAFAACLKGEHFEDSVYVNFAKEELTKSWYQYPESGFTHFAGYAGIFEQWERKIQKSKYTYFYWENSY